MLGEKIQELGYYLLSHNLTPEQEDHRIEQAQLALARTVREQEELEEEAAHLAAHGDYVLNQVKAARQMRRYIDPESLWTYVRDALIQDFPGTELVRLGDDPLTVEIGLSQHARVEFQHFLELTKLLGKTRLLRGGTESRLRCVFSSKVDFATARHEVINQLHPLVRFVTARAKKDMHLPLVAAGISPYATPAISPGTYLVSSQMWSTTGARTLEKLVFKGTNLLTGAGLTDEQAETLINAAAHQGGDWPASRGLMDPDLALNGYQDVLDRLDDQFPNTPPIWRWKIRIGWGLFDRSLCAQD